MNNWINKFTSYLRFSIKAKITLPYIFLSLIIALGGAFLITELIIQSIDQRFDNSLVETSKISADIMVQEEVFLLETVRLIANSKGMDFVVLSENSEILRDIALPIAYNHDEDSIIILNLQGLSLLSLNKTIVNNIVEYHSSKSSNNFSQMEFVQNVLANKNDSQGDKFAGVASNDGQQYIYIAGPIKNGNGDLVGVVMVGKLVENISRTIRQETLAQVTIYSEDGQILESTFRNEEVLAPALAETVLADQEESSLLRDFEINDIKYRELISMWEIRGQKDVGFMGVAFSSNFLSETNRETRIQVFIFVSIMLFLTIITGILIARRITNPISELKTAALAVSKGNLDIQITPIGQDEVAVLSRTFNEMIANLKNSKAEIIQAYDLTLEGWTKALEFKDRETEGHTQRVTDLTVEVSSLFGVTDEKLEHFRRGALLHDIGKVGIPDRILQKPGPLTVQEFERIKKHPIYAYQMLSKISFLKEAIEIPFSHHEKWDGSGYPQGLKGREIPLGARIFALVDVWDAITTDRVYRKAMSIQQAVAIIAEGKGTHFDPRMVGRFLKYLSTSGRLSNSGK